MLKSSGFRFLIVGVLALFMLIPLGLVGEIIYSRTNYSQSTIQSLSHEWGGEQLFSGPQLVIPVQQDVTYDRKRELRDPVSKHPLRDDKNNILYEYFQETVTENRDPVYIYPDRFDLNVSTKTQSRHRGIFNVPVYTAEVQALFDMPAEQAKTALVDNEVLLWDQAELRFFLSANRALRGDAELKVDAKKIALEPLSSDKNGISGLVGDPRNITQYKLQVGVNGAQSLRAAAVGRTSTVNFSSDWPHPSFFGDFLPDGSEISDAGFTANWQVPHLARNLPQVGRRDVDGAARQYASMGVRFITPNDFYQKAHRSAEYGILFIALTFLTILLLDRTSERPTHPVQYLMVGLAQSVFVLLMLAYAEQIGFGLAYLIASAATIGVLVMFGATALKLGRRAGVLGLMLVILYGVLYLILQSADYALLAGATLAFAALAGTMYLTRNEDWHGPERDPSERRVWFGRRAVAKPDEPTER